jgi:hypothetical protein
VYPLTGFSTLIFYIHFPHFNDVSVQGRHRLNTSHKLAIFKSLAYIVGVGELSFVAAQVNSRLIIYPAEIFMFIGLIYVVLCSGLGRFADRAAAYFQATTT